MTIEEGEFVADTAASIEEAMLATAKEQFGDDLNDDQLAVIRLFIRPIAQELEKLQNDIGLVLSGSQVDNATGQSLDLLTSLIGVPRRSAQKATGEVTFSRSSAASKDYTIPKNTAVQTDSLEPVRFYTTEAAILQSGETSVSNVSVEAATGGKESNLGANTLTVMPSAPTGIYSVTNPEQTSGGKDVEGDEDLRSRAKEELAEGSAATPAALISACRGVEGVRDVTIFINDTSIDNNYGNGLPSHSFELVVLTDSTEAQQEVGQAILDTKAAGDNSAAGYNGTDVSITGDLPNGQTHGISYSEPTETQIYIGVDLIKKDNYAGDDKLLSHVVDYIGGVLPTGNGTDGVGVNEDVIYRQVEQKIMGTQGVHDLNSLYIGTSSFPSGTGNITIGAGEVAISDATDGSITITKNDL